MGPKFHYGLPLTRCLAREDGQLVALAGGGGSGCARCCDAVGDRDIMGHFRRHLKRRSLRKPRRETSARVPQGGVASSRRQRKPLLPRGQAMAAPRRRSSIAWISPTHSRSDRRGPSNRLDATPAVHHEESDARPPKPDIIPPIRGLDLILRHAHYNHKRRPTASKPL